MIDLTNHPSVEYGGYIYAIDMSDDRVKVGCTQNPAGRLASLRAQFSIFGVEVRSVWISDLHDEWEENEVSLLALTSAVSVGVAGREYFTGPSLEDVRQMASTLTYSPVDPYRYLQANRLVETLKASCAPGLDLLAKAGQNDWSFFLDRMLAAAPTSTGTVDDWLDLAGSIARILGIPVGEVRSTPYRDIIRLVVHRMAEPSIFDLTSLSIDQLIAKVEASK